MNTDLRWTRDRNSLRCCRFGRLVINKVIQIVSLTSCLRRQLPKILNTK